MCYDGCECGADDELFPELPDTHHLIVVLNARPHWDANDYGWGCEHGMAYSTRDEAIVELRRFKVYYPLAVVILCEVGLEPEGDHAIETWIKVCM